MRPQDFFRTQSALSDPGAFAPLFDALPDDLDSLCRTVRNVYIHYMSGRFPHARKAEVDLRYINTILERVMAHDDRPLSMPRARAKKTIGCCRDAALLLCSMLRHKGIPARIRVGFATYIRLSDEPYNVDHVVTEMWDEALGRWKLVDAEQGEALIEHNRIDFDVHDIPRDRFLVGGAAWQRIFGWDGDNPARYGGGPGDFFSGEWAVRVRLLNDLAALNKVEPLLWDTWGWMRYEFKPSRSDLAVLDNMAALTQQGDEAFDAIRALYADPRFAMPESVMCYSPANKPKRVQVTV